MKISPRKYYYLGLFAVISTLAASLLSLYVYIVYHKNDYLHYFIFWFIICFIDIIVWRKPPKQEEEKSFLEENIPENP